MWFLTILSCLFLFLPQESFFPLPTPENHRLELLVVELPIAVQVTSLARRRELQLFGPEREKFNSFAISASVGGQSSQCALQSKNLPLCSAYCGSFAAYLRSSSINTWAAGKAWRVASIHLRKVPTSKTKSIVFQLTSSEVVIHRNSFLSINPSKLTSNNLRNIYDLSSWH